MQKLSSLQLIENSSQGILMTLRRWNWYLGITLVLVRLFRTKRLHTTESEECWIIVPRTMCVERVEHIHCKKSSFIHEAKKCCLWCFLVLIHITILWMKQRFLISSFQLSVYSWFYTVHYSFVFFLTLWGILMTFFFKLKQLLLRHYCTLQHSVPNVSGSICLAYMKPISYVRH